MSNKTATTPPSLSEDLSNGNGFEEEGIDLNGKAILQPNLSEDELEKQRRHEEYNEELLKIQEDIATLRLVLNDKVKRENELKTLLGVSFVDEFKQDFSEGLNSIKSTVAFQKTAETLGSLSTSISQYDAFQKTSAGLKTAGAKITPAFSGLGNSMKSGLGSFRNSTMFKSFESGISNSFSTNKLSSSQSEFNVEGSGNAANQMSTSKSTLGTTNGNSGFDKQDTIMEDKN